MRKFQSWLKLRENNGTIAPGANTMDQSGDTPMPLGQAHGQANPNSAGVQDQNQGEGEDTALTGNMQRHLDMLIADLEKSQRIPRAKTIEVLDKVVQALKGGGMKKQQAMSTMKGGFQ